MLWVFANNCLNQPCKPGSNCSNEWVVWFGYTLVAIPLYVCNRQFNQHADYLVESIWCPNIYVLEKDIRLSTMLLKTPPVLWWGKARQVLGRTTDRQGNIPWSPPRHGRWQSNHLYIPQVIYWYFSRLSDSNLRGRGMQLVKSQSGAKDTPDWNIRAAQNLDRS